MALPRYVAFRSYTLKKYILYKHEKGEYHGYLQFQGDAVVSPYTIYEIELSAKYDNLVHIRCCYSNKYWVKASSCDHFIAALADDANEDRSQWCCTLFEPIGVSGYGFNAYRFRHVKTGNYVMVLQLHMPFVNSVSAGFKHTDAQHCDIINVINCESLLVLPKHVAFKGDNDLYLRTVDHGDDVYLQFSGNDIRDPAVGNEVVVNKDGTICIKSCYNRRFWSRSSNWIVADRKEIDVNDPNMLFSPDKVCDKVVLKNLGSNCNCMRINADGKTSCLNADGKTSCLNSSSIRIPKQAQLKVEEFVDSRNIYDLKFRVSDAKIYDLKIFTAAYDYVSNSGNEKSDLDISLSYTSTESSTWSTSYSMKSGARYTIVTGIPMIVEGKIEIPSEVSGLYTWGGTKTVETKISRSFKVSVPKKTRMKVSMIATEGHYSVPFSYTRRDVLFNGDSVITQFDDGIYTGVNCYNFQHKVEEK